MSSEETFSHLFPPTADNIGAIPAPNVTKDEGPTRTLNAPPAEPALKPTLSNNAPITCKGGIDYVIVFRVPTAVPVNHPTIKTRDDLEAHVAAQLKNLTDSLTRVHFRFQIRPGKDKGTLLVLVSCPINPIKKKYRQDRIRDFLLGVRIDKIGDDPRSSNDNVDADFNNLTEAERLRLVYEILTLPEAEGGAGIDPETDEYVDSIMPLHNDEYIGSWVKSLSKKWIIDDKDLLVLRNYSGEKIAYYFAFLQFYSIWLIGPAVLGLLIYLTHSNTLTISFSLCMLLWSVVFIEMWKRKESELAVQWGVRNYSKYDKRRPTYKGDKIIKDQVTGDDVPFVSPWKLLARRISSLPGVAVGASFLTAIVGFVFFLQLFLHEYYTGPFKKFLHYAPTVGYVLFIPNMTNIYSKWVKTLTNWEMHETESSWESSYTQKIFIANFLVGYLSLFITGWIYIPFDDHILPYLSSLNISHEHQTVDFLRLRSQLVYFIVTGQIIGFATEMVVPYLMRKLLPKAKKIASKNNDKNNVPMTDLSQNEEEKKTMDNIYRQVGLAEYNVYTDYVEMVIQFGYVSMFSTVWPLTPLCCMLNNWVEFRGDVLKVWKYSRRSVPSRAESIGPWSNNLEVLIWLSSITMSSFAYLYHPSTEIHSSYTPIFTIIAILISEHIYLAMRVGVHQLLKLLPQQSEFMVRQEDYRIKKNWLGSMVGNHQQFVVQRSVDSDDNSDLQDSLSSKVWGHHLDRQAEATEGIQLVQTMFKNK